MPTTKRGNSTGFSKAAMVLVGGPGLDKAGGGRAPRSRATSSSMDFIMASASSVRPMDSSQRGDSGRALRRYHTTSPPSPASRSEEHTSELQSRRDFVCRLLLEKKKNSRLLPMQ